MALTEQSREMAELGITDFQEYLRYKASQRAQQPPVVKPVVQPKVSNIRQVTKEMQELGITDFQEYLRYKAAQPKPAAKPVVQPMTMAEKLRQEREGLARFLRIKESGLTGTEYAAREREEEAARKRASREKWRQDIEAASPQAVEGRRQAARRAAIGKRAPEAAVYARTPEERERALGLTPAQIAIRQRGRRRIRAGGEPIALAEWGAEERAKRERPLARWGATVTGQLKRRPLTRQPGVIPGRKRETTAVEQPIRGYGVPQRRRKRRFGM